MKTDYNISDEVFIIHQQDKKFNIKKGKISSIDVKCENKDITYKIKIDDDDTSCGFRSYYSKQLFKTKLLAEQKLAELLQSLKFKIGDIVILNKELCKKDKYNTNYVFSIDSIELSIYDNYLYYNLYIIFSHNWSSLNNVPKEVFDEHLIKVNVNHLKTLFDYKKLLNECKEIENNLSIKEKELRELLDDVKNTLDYNLEKYNSRYSRFFNTDEYKNAKLIFGDNDK